MQYALPRFVIVNGEGPLTLTLGIQGFSRGLEMPMESGEYGPSLPKA